MDTHIFAYWCKEVDNLSDDEQHRSIVASADHRIEHPDLQASQKADADDGVPGPRVESFVTMASTIRMFVLLPS